MSKQTGVACRTARQVKELEAESHDLSSPTMKRQNWHPEVVLRPHTVLHTITAHAIRRKRQWAGRLDRATALPTERAPEHKAATQKATHPRLLGLQRLSRTALSSPLLSTCRLGVGRMGDRKNSGCGQPGLTYTPNAKPLPSHYRACGETQESTQKWLNG